MLIASKKAIAENREGVIRFLVGWIQTQKLMSSTKPEDQDEFAKIAAEGQPDRPRGGERTRSGVPEAALLGEQ